MSADDLPYGDAGRTVVNAVPTRDAVMTPAIAFPSVGLLRCPESRADAHDEHGVDEQQPAVAMDGPCLFTNRATVPRAMASRVRRYESVRPCLPRLASSQAKHPAR